MGLDAVTKSLALILSNANLKKVHAKTKVAKDTLDNEALAKNHVEQNSASSSIVFSDSLSQEAFGPLHKTHAYYMQMAFEEAYKAKALGEVPVGAIIVDNEGNIIARAGNRTILNHDASAHAEIMAIRQAGEVIKNYRLNNLSMYVTLEPCCMCAMALVHARIKNLVYSALDPRTGACGSVFNLAQDTRHNHSFNIIGGVMQEQGSQILKDFFKERREAKKALKEHKKLNLPE